MIGAYRMGGIPLGAQNPYPTQTRPAGPPETDPDPSGPEGYVRDGIYHVAE